MNIDLIVPRYYYIDMYPLKDMLQLTAWRLI